MSQPTMFILMGPSESGASAGLNFKMRSLRCMVALSTSLLKLTVVGPDLTPFCGVRSVIAMFTLTINAYGKVGGALSINSRCIGFVIPLCFVLLAQPSAAQAEELLCNNARATFPGAVIQLQERLQRYAECTRRVMGPKIAVLSSTACGPSKAALKQ